MSPVPSMSDPDRSSGGSTGEGGVRIGWKYCCTGGGLLEQLLEERDLEQDMEGLGLDRLHSKDILKKMIADESRHNISILYWNICL
jgi:hypothetical protein